MKIKLLKFSAILFISLFAFVGCDEGTVEGSTEQQIYFEVSYSNSAWGKQFKGFIIDRDGQIRLYEKPAKWNQASGKTGLTSDQIKENLLNTTLASTSIAVVDLKNYVSKSITISDSAFSKPISGGADRGITSYYIYTYDKETQVYKSVLISQTGDIETYNKDKSAIEVSTWLSTVVDQVY